MATTVSATRVLGPRPWPEARAADGYRRVLVPVDAAGESERAVDVACQLVREHGSAVLALTVVEVALDMPLDVPLSEDEARAHAALATARAIGDSYGVTVRGRTVRARSAGPAVVEEAQRAGSDLVVLAAPRRLR